MNPKPTGKQYRNLVRYGGRIVYEKVRGGERERIVLVDGDRPVTDWDLAAKIRDALEQGIEYKPVPTVREAFAAYTDAGCDGVLAVGGGSSMDVAKVVAALAVGQQDLPAMYGVRRSRHPESGVEYRCGSWSDA